MLWRAVAREHGQLRRKLVVQCADARRHALVLGGQPVLRRRLRIARHFGRRQCLLLQLYGRLLRRPVSAAAASGRDGGGLHRLRRQCKLAERSLRAGGGVQRQASVRYGSHPRIRALPAQQPVVLDDWDASAPGGVRKLGLGALLRPRRLLSRVPGWCGLRGAVAGVEFVGPRMAERDCPRCIARLME